MTPVGPCRTLFTHQVVLITVSLKDLEWTHPSFVQFMAIRAHLDVDQIADIVGNVFPIGVVTLFRQVLLLSNIVACSLDDHLS